MVRHCVTLSPIPQALLKVKTEGPGCGRRREEDQADPLMAMLMCLQVKDGGQEQEEGE